MTSISERARVKVDRCPVCDFNLTVASKPRSVDQNRRYWALIKAAFEQWPEDHDFQPKDEGHLRKWLQCKAGHYVASTFELPQTDDPVLHARMMEFAENLLNVDEGHKFGRWHGLNLTVFTPKSIAFDKLHHKAACQLFDEVAAFIEDAIGVSAEQLLRERAA